MLYTPMLFKYIASSATSCTVESLATLHTHRHVRPVPCNEIEECGVCVFHLRKTFLLADDRKCDVKMTIHCYVFLGTNAQPKIMQQCFL